MIKALVAGVALAVCAGFVACATSGKGGGGERRVPPVEDWRKQRPAPGADLAPKLPAFQVAETKSGMQLFLVEDHALPIVTASVVVAAGSAHEAAKDPGLAALVYDLLDEGAGGLSAFKLAEAFQEVGAFVQTNADREHGVVAVDVAKQHVDRALELVALVVQKPTFAAEDFERVRARRLATLAARRGAASSVARDVFAASVYGLDHPYGHPHEGTVAALEKLTVKQAKRFWQDVAGPKSSALVLVGDVTLDEAKALADKHFGKWRGGAKPAKPPPDVAARAALSIKIVDMPGAPQTVLRVGRPLAASNDPDDAALTVFNDVLGGAFTSRLNLKLREEKQWTYGAYSAVDARRGKGPFVVVSDVVTDKTADALKEVLAQFAALRDAPPSEAELALAKDSFTKSLTGWFGGQHEKVAAAARLFVQDLPPDFYEKKVEAVRAVTAADVQRAAQRALVDADMVVVLVGDKASIEAPVKALAVGDVSEASAP